MDGVHRLANEEDFSVETAERSVERLLLRDYSVCVVQA